MSNLHQLFYTIFISLARQPAFILRRSRGREFLSSDIVGFEPNSHSFLYDVLFFAINCRFYCRHPWYRVYSVLHLLKVYKITLQLFLFNILFLMYEYQVPQIIYKLNPFRKTVGRDRLPPFLVSYDSSLDRLNLLILLPIERFFLLLSFLKRARLRLLSQ